MIKNVDTTTDVPKPKATLNKETLLEKYHPYKDRFMKCRIHPIPFSQLEWMRTCEDVYHDPGAKQVPTKAELFGEEKMNWLEKIENQKEGEPCPVCDRIPGLETDDDIEDEYIIYEDANNPNVHFYIQKEEMLKWDQEPREQVKKQYLPRLTGQSLLTDGDVISDVKMVFNTQPNEKFVLRLMKIINDPQAKE